MLNYYQNNPKPFSNPVLIYGSSFGNYFQALYKLAKHEEMLKFTSSKTVNKFGRSSIEELYKKMNFGYVMKLQNKKENDDGSITLNYITLINATKGILRINVIIENDTAKIILSTLNQNNPF